MTAKVSAAVSVASAGIPVVITSGKGTDNIIQVLQGKRIGTLFHQDVHLWTVKEYSAREMAVAASECSRRLQSLDSQDRTKILVDIAHALEANESLIKTENDADVAEAEEAGYEKGPVSRLTLKPGKIYGLAKSIRKLAAMEEPIGRIITRTELADRLILEKISSPLGVLLVIFKSRPDALVQIVCLAIWSGNGVLLNGGKEAKRSNAILHKVITSAIPDSVGDKLIGLFTSIEERFLTFSRGGNKLVSQIKDSTKIPVLGHADGICRVYVDKSANINMAKHIVMDAKIDYPAACNAMETLLIHENLARNGGLSELVEELQSEGVILRTGPRASALLNIPAASTLHHEFNSLACTIEIVDDVKAAIEHIHQHGSGHTDCIVT